MNKFLFVLIALFSIQSHAQSPTSASPPAQPTVTGTPLPITILPLPRPNITVDLEEFPNRKTIIAEALAASKKVCNAYSAAYMKEYASNYKIPQTATPFVSYCFRYFKRLNSGPVPLNMTMILQSPELFKPYLDDIAKEFEGLGYLKNQILRAKMNTKIFDTDARTQALEIEIKALKNQVEEHDSEMQNLNLKSKGSGLFEMAGLKGSAKAILVDVLILLSAIVSALFIFERIKNR